MQHAMRHEDLLDTASFRLQLAESYRVASTYIQHDVCTVLIPSCMCSTVLALQYGYCNGSMLAGNSKENLESGPNLRF